MTPTIVDLLRELVSTGAAKNFVASGHVAPAAFMVDATGQVYVLTNITDVAAVSQTVRSFHEKNALQAAALVAEFWMATARSAEDLTIRPSDRADRHEMVRIEIVTPVADYAWKASIIRAEPARLGPFEQTGAALVGPFARLLRAEREN